MIIKLFIRGKYEEFSAIYNALKSISSNNNPNKDNVIETIKGQLSQDSDAYKEWEKGVFNLDHVFTTENDYGVSSKHTLLTVACERADLEVVKFLINVGAGVNKVGERGWTPLIIAIEKESDPKHKGLVDLLVKAEADVNAAGEDGFTPISKAVERGNLKVFNILKGANVNVQCPGRVTLLQWVENHKEYVENKQDMDGIIGIIKTHSKEKTHASTKPIGNNGAGLWSEHKGKIALSIAGLCVAGAVTAYVFVYPVVALVLAVLAAVILIGAGVTKVLEDPSAEEHNARKNVFIS